MSSAVRIIGTGVLSAVMVLAFGGAAMANTTHEPRHNDRNDQNVYVVVDTDDERGGRFRGRHHDDCDFGHFGRGGRGGRGGIDIEDSNFIRQDQIGLVNLGLAGIFD